MAKYKSKLKRNSKFNPKSERFKRHMAFSALDYIQTCEGKVAYGTINKARQVKKRMKTPMGIYKCPNCGKYHLTSE